MLDELKKITKKEWVVIFFTLLLPSLVIFFLSSFSLGNTAAALFIIAYCVPALLFHLYARKKSIYDSKAYSEAGTVSGMGLGALLVGVSTGLTGGNLSQIINSSMLGALVGVFFGSVLGAIFWAFVVNKKASSRVGAVLLPIIAVCFLVFCIDLVNTYLFPLD